MLCQSVLDFCLHLVLDHPVYPQLLGLRALEVLDDLVEVVLALAYFYAHVERLAALLVCHDLPGELFGLSVEELLAIGDVPQQLLLDLMVVAPLALLLHLGQLAHALVLQQPA